MEFVFHLLLNALLILVIAKLIPGVHVQNFGTAILAAFILGLVNFLVLPVLHVLLLPVTIITLGLFALVINGLAFWLTAVIVPGFYVRGFLESLISVVIFWAANTFLASQGIAF